MTLELVSAALIIASVLALVVVVQLTLIAARLRSIHQEMIDTHETLKRGKDQL